MTTLRRALLLALASLLTGCGTQPPQPLPTLTPYTPALDALPAFPGAEGFGSATRGGRGGRVIEVTSLSDAGSGSLREAIEATGPRVIVFRVAGTIELQSTLIVEHPYVTIAGQTAPGAGITLRGVHADVEALLRIATHDVVVRYLTFRAGPPSAGDALEIFATHAHDTYNVVVDHNSLSWAVNRNLATWYDVHDISIQWNIFSEGLNCSIHPKGCHSKGVLIGGYASDEDKDKPGAHSISLHHNLMAHNGERNPYIEAAGVIDVVNNVAYNPFGTFSHIDMVYQVAPVFVNYIGNYYKPGPNTDHKYAVEAMNAGQVGIYAQGNIGSYRETDDLPETDIIDPNSRKFVTTQPFPAAPITVTSALQAYEAVLAEAGAYQGLNCDGTFFLRRDAIDSRIIREVEEGTGRIIDDPSEVRGWLTIPAASPCADTDHDGMFDLWEQNHGFNPNDPADAVADADGDGYTNLEEFLNGTNPLS